MSDETSRVGVRTFYTVHKEAAGGRLTSVHVDDTYTTLREAVETANQGFQPVRGIKERTEPTGETRWVTMEEIEAILND